MHFPEFEWLIDPMLVETFRREYLETKPLHLVDRQADRYASIFSVAEIEHLLWSHEAEFARSIILIKNGERFSIAASDAARLRMSVNTHFAEGATILLPAVGRFVAGVAKIQRAVEEFCGAHVIVNAYLTPPHSQGFEPHFDAHDIFVLQIDGRKNWRLFDSCVVLPTISQLRVVSHEELSEPFWTPELRAGDLLYLPRGVIHEARTHETASLHLTIGFQLPSWADVLADCVRVATDSSPALRRSVVASPQPAPGLLSVVDALQALSGADNILARAQDRIRARFVANLQPLPRPQPDRFNSFHMLSADDYVERVPGMLAQVFDGDTVVRITFPGLGSIYEDGKVPIAITEPLFLERALRFIATSEDAFRVRDLPVKVDDETKVAFIRRFVTYGLLQLAHSPTIGINA